MDKAAFIHKHIETVRKDYERDSNYASSRFAGRINWLTNQAERLMRFEEFMEKYDGKVRCDFTIEQYNFIQPTLNLYALEGTTWADMNTWVEEFFGEANEIEDNEGDSVSWRRFRYQGFRVDLNLNELCSPVYETVTETAQVVKKKLIGVNCGDKIVSFGTAPAAEPGTAPADLSDQHEDPPRDQDNSDLDQISDGIEAAEKKDLDDGIPF